MKEKIIYEKFLPLIPLIQEKNISFELNTSGLRKSTHNINKKYNIDNLYSYPSSLLISELNSYGISFTIGSDAHSPELIGKGIKTILNKLNYLGVKELSYYENRKRIQILLKNINFN